MDDKTSEATRTKLDILARRIKEARSKAKLTQDQLSKKINREVKSISLWENSHRVPDAEALVDLAIALGVSTDWLLGLSNRQPIDVLTGEEQALLEKFRGLSPRVRGRLVGMLDALEGLE